MLQPVDPVCTLEDMAVGQHIACHSTRKTPPQAIPPGPLPCHGPMANSQIQKSIEFVDPPPPCLKNHPGKSKETVGSLWQTIVQVVQLLNPQILKSFPAVPRAGYDC